MKNLWMAFALIMIGQVSFAQDSFKADMKEYMKLSGQLSSFEMVTKNIVNEIPAAKQEDFKKELKVSIDGLMDKMAEMYMTEFTQDDVKKLIEFYQSPIGKKLTEKNEVLFEKGQVIGQEWGMGLNGIMTKYME